MQLAILRMINILRAIESHGYTVFYEYAGHVKWISLRVAKPMPDYDKLLYSKMTIEATNIKDLLDTNIELVKLCDELSVTIVR
jgi:hypothetical protein